MSDSVWPHRQQPTRLPRPWDSPGKNTGVGCHFLLQCMKVKSEREVSQSCPTLRDPMDCSLPGSSLHGIFQARVLEWDGFREINKSQITWRPTGHRVFLLQKAMGKYFAWEIWSHVHFKKVPFFSFKILTAVWRSMLKNLISSRRGTICDSPLPIK